MASRATMATVAEIAGVSIPTVSRVLAGKPEISEETRLRVHDAVQATGYLVRGGRRRSVGGAVDVLIDGDWSPWALELLGGAEQAAFELGHNLVVASTGHPDFGVADWLDRHRSRQTAGVVLVLSGPGRADVAGLDELPVPLVVVDLAGSNTSTIPTVGATNWAGGLAATRHLLKLGHNRIGLIGGPGRMECARERHEGYLAAHREYGIEPDPNLARSADLDVAGGTSQGGALLDSEDPPTAVFTCSDSQAAGVYQAAADRGLRVPRDLSVVGFDDTTICALLAPPLTTIRQPLTEMAAEAVRLIAQEQATPGSARGRRVELATSLIVRGSTAGCRERTRATARREQA